MRGFVGYGKASATELQTLIKDPEFAIAPSYYFLRWAHEVSGITLRPPKGSPSPEGQLFNAKLELRWKQQHDYYEVLLLSETEPNTSFEFKAIAGEWDICNHAAHFYDRDVTKFPKAFVYRDAEGQTIAPKTIAICQRYFRNTQTATVHFVALSVKTRVTA
ncbi:hypothetical protein [Phormidesmis priestleyi]